MLQLLGLILVIAAIYGVKAFFIVRQHAQLAEQDTSFNFMSMREEDEATAESWTVEEEPAVPMIGLRGVHA